VNSPELSRVNSPELSRVSSPELSRVSSPELSCVDSPELSCVDSPELVCIDSPELFRNDHLTFARLFLPLIASFKVARCFSHNKLLFVTISPYDLIEKSNGIASTQCCHCFSQVIDHHMIIFAMVKAELNLLNSHTIMCEKLLRIISP
jgi:hypothetical protein